ncbi:MULTISPECIES: FkbM family methyltransferase [unclassified Desulfovibrio]|uniref:FkbM family methyltransferase n=1 Tax=unclassified Desulfovibrio TaxID=2593640 RepID=UPI000F5FCD48|nr:MULTISPECIES: FkbM family methyltransferase [unclassified Desulfovibrio]RRD70846.1 FkbM family methyltransferase [Desulfovibrio sp. OH1209_COT-279]RRD87234.1 FkbM family methyltransferase [Desulfovibrio sp. OH1186_COT-070]
MKACPVILWGAGNTALYYSGILAFEGIFPEFFVDSAQEKIGTCLNGIPVRDVRSITALEEPLVLVATPVAETFSVIQRQALTLNPHAHCFSVDTYLMEKNKERIQEVSDLFSDAASRKKYAAVVESRKNMSDVPAWVVESPFLRYESPLSFQLPRLDDIVVDAGAYCGDSLEKFLLLHDAHMREYYAFEPDERFFAALVARSKRLAVEWALDGSKLVPVKYALGRESGDACLRNWDLPGGGSALLHGDAPPWERVSRVQLTSIDSFFAGKDITFLKADIEGAEYDMLLGAKETICRCRPRLAISLYHSPSDMYRIPLLLKSFSLGYRFAFHHYSPTWGDSLLYAW